MNYNLVQRAEVQMKECMIGILILRRNTMLMRITYQLDEKNYTSAKIT